MTEVPSPQLRISDLTRESALAALGEHMSAGRIDIDEYGERSARITAAKTRGELGEIFADLPAPHPKYEDSWQTVEKPPPPPSTVPQPVARAQQSGWSPAQRLLAGLMPLIFIAAIALMATGVVDWWIIFVPIGLAAIGKSMWGHGWDGGHDRHVRDRERRRELRDDYRRRRGLDR